MALVNSLNDDIPFGIRALLEDPDVDGVWNSRANTPRYYDGPATTCSPLPSESVVRSQNPSSNSSTLIHDISFADTGLASSAGNEQPPFTGPHTNLI